MTEDTFGPEERMNTSNLLHEEQERAIPEEGQFCVGATSVKREGEFILIIIIIFR